MNRIIKFLCLFLFSATAYGQITPKFQDPLVYGKKENRFLPLQMQGLPRDTIQPPRTPEDLSIYPWLAVIGGNPYLYNTITKFWDPWPGGGAGGGSGTITSVFGRNTPAIVAQASDYSAFYAPLAGYNKATWDKAIIRGSFNESTRILKLTRVNGTDTSISIPGAAPEDIIVIQERLNEIDSSGAFNVAYLDPIYREPTTKEVGVKYWANIWNASRIQGRYFSPIIPRNRDFIAWDSLSNQYRPMSVDSIYRLESGLHPYFNGFGVLMPNDSTFAVDRSVMSTKGYVDSAMANVSVDLSPFELLSNKSTSTTLGSSNTLYPTQNAVKTYVDNAVTGINLTPYATKTALTDSMKVMRDSIYVLRQLLNAQAAGDSAVIDLSQINDSTARFTWSTGSHTDLIYRCPGCSGSGGGGSGGISQQQLNDTAAAIRADITTGTDATPAHVNAITTTQINAWNAAAGGRSFVNVMDYGADPTGVADSKAAFVAAQASGKDIFVPEGNFKIVGAGGLAATQIALADNQNLFGVGRKSVIQITGNFRLFSIGENSEIKQLYLKGDGKSGGGNFQAGIFVALKKNWLIADCYFSDFSGDAGQNGGGAICVGQIAGANSEGGRIINPWLNNNDVGINFMQRGEYVTVINPKAVNNNTGICIGAGNIIINGGDVQLNTIGIRMVDGTNDGHGIVSGVTINHNTTNLSISDVSEGMTFSGCNLYSGNITITNSLGIKFIGCDFSTGSITLTNNTAIMRANCRVPLAPKAHAMPISLVSGSNFIEDNNLDF